MQRGPRGHEFLYKRAPGHCARRERSAQNFQPRPSTCAWKRAPGIADNEDVKDVIGVRLRSLTGRRPATEPSGCCIADHPPSHAVPHDCVCPPLHSAPVRFATTLPALMRIFDQGGMST
jgi:hypothetical protein